MLCLLMSCGGGSADNAGSGANDGTKDFSGYTLMDYSADGYQNAKKYHPKDGFILSEGPLYNNMREGAWMSYHAGRDSGKIKTVTNYHQDVKTGVELEFATSGNLSKRVDYDNGQMHGIYAEYKYNRPLKYAEYTKGQLDGAYRTFYSNGKLQQYSAYKDGKKNGKSIFYNEEEQVIMEYVYENDEKISGGTVTPPPIVKEK